ncbi:hypothetical protein BGY98DRAFT_1098134 [Russula aff. rugulosa BPL654]|nr:hypothetical protein BGY98DRAFT_1098134 [Russula aff. rugulosa BPL654]
MPALPSSHSSPFSTNVGPYLMSSHSTKSASPGEEFGSPEFWAKMLVSVLLVLLGGVFAGLTLGLMGLDELHLRVLSTSSEDVTRGRTPHKIGGGIAAIVISSTMIVIFGYGDPSSRSFESYLTKVGLCTLVNTETVSVRYGLSIGSRCVPIVLVMMYFFAPIAWPIAKLLDHVLGKNDVHTYKKAELKSFLQFHRTGEEPLRDDEISILNGVLELNTKKDVVTLSSDTILDTKMIDFILLSGYSRFPIHEPGNPLAFSGLLLVKKLLTYDPSQCWPVSKFTLSILPEAKPTINCFQALDYFQTGRAHLLLISNTPGIGGGAIGVITLEDVIEEIISEEIVDETDQFEDNQSKRRAKRMTTAAVMRGIVERERRSEPAIPNSEERTPLLVMSPGSWKLVAQGLDTEASDLDPPRT